ncbi:hypothetical protein Bhyg_09132 [Pseudolycoriella hygida]|uniref:Uncharacterized protein n=1 Tax=Pseudolycoriella hygida TaxID=35572 RepID=A0A9Q0N764_9DIPT|nr:hypothetical protein Bhyg_09132 [Pseudolycoriella hygida]
MFVTFVILITLAVYQDAPEFEPNRFDMKSNSRRRKKLFPIGL